MRSHDCERGTPGACATLKYEYAPHCPRLRVAGGPVLRVFAAGTAGQRLPGGGLVGLPRLANHCPDRGRADLASSAGLGAAALEFSGLAGSRRHARLLRVLSAGLSVWFSVGR